MHGWALDLGTTNTGLARWDKTADRPQIFVLPRVSREQAPDDPLEAPRVVPSATHLISERDLATRIGALPLVSRFALLGKQAEIGRPALEKNAGVASSAFVRSFKPLLAHSPLQSIARAGGKTYSARDVARVYVRELMAEVRRSGGERIRGITVTAPVESFEMYRAEVAGALRAAGVRDVHFADEPVAAALGYGLSLKHERIVLVVDFGGGTLHLAVVKMSARSMEQGTCEVLAKTGRPIGGNTVDEWLFAWCCERLGYPLPTENSTDDERFWLQMMLLEASRVKEALFVRPTETLLLTPPEEMRHFEAQLRGAAGTLDVTRDDLVAVLRANGLYDTLGQCVTDIETQMKTRGLVDSDIGDVLMVGGSTLLPEIYKYIEERFGRARVRAFQPFEAVAYGACVLAAGAVRTSDFIVHDYALMAHDLKTHKPRFEVVIPRGTRFPTSEEFWKRAVVPTCSQGIPESIFRLVIAEIGSHRESQRTFGWDQEGNLQRFGGATATEGDPVVVPLNESDPALGELRPAHEPGDTAARLSLAFGVNADRWLIATVRDLKTQRVLMNKQPIVKLL